MRVHPILGGMRMHSGVDLAAPAGSPIFATYSGKVTSAGWAGGYGLSAAVESDSGVQTRFGHMSRVTVSRGQSVRKGDLIGYVGSTGLSTGPHLHYEVRLKGQAVDPAPLLKARSIHRHQG
jgi:murein DD-endopeptidase MepM/ murein hydrolase activator NlpD